MGNPLLFVDPQGTTGFFEWLQSLAMPPMPSQSPVFRQSAAVQREVVKQSPKLLAASAAAPVVVAVGVVAWEPIAAGGLIGFGVDATRQGIKQVETGRPGFDWSEAGTATGTGMLLGPVSRIPGAKHVLILGGGALGVNSAYHEAEQGNYATALFDVAVSTYPAAAEYGKHIPNLPKFSLPKAQPVRTAVTPDGQTVAVTGEEGPVASRAPAALQADAGSAAGNGSGRKVYRVIRPDEVPAEGLHPKDPSATYTPDAHVTMGSRLKDAVHLHHERHQGGPVLGCQDQQPHRGGRPVQGSGTHHRLVHGGRASLQSTRNDGQELREGFERSSDRRLCTA